MKNNVNSAYPASLQFRALHGFSPLTSISL